MDNSVEKTGKSIDEALKAALEELEAEKEDVDVEILDEGTKGILGLIGSKMAKVRVTLKANPGQKAKKFIEEVISKMGLKADVAIKDENNAITATISGSDMGVLIGRRGETLDALQYLTSLHVNNGKGPYKKVVIDTENYRRKREETLEKLAHKLADRVIKYRRPITLEPMNPNERRIIHSTLQGNTAIKTYSVGDEPNRKVVISLK